MFFNETRLISVRSYWKNVNNRRTWLGGRTDGYKQCLGVRILVFEMHLPGLIYHDYHIFIHFNISLLRF